MDSNIVITKEDDTYIAKDVKTGVADQGETVEEAESNLKSALKLFYEN